MSIEKAIVAEVTKVVKSDKGIHEALISKLNDAGYFPQIRTVKIKNGNKKVRNIPNQHKQFETVLRAVSAKVNICLVGPSGSFKTTMAENVAEALEEEFYSKSVSSQTGVHEFFGYQDANGQYVKTLFREAYENGGVFLLDEFDNGNPNVLASLNQATANSRAPFPDGMIEKHEDFLLIMAGNTWGTGPNSEYVGRNKIDAATLDRFMFLEIEYDEELEFILSTNKEWCEEVQNYRANAQAKRVKAVISPRATFMGERLLKAGIDKEQVLKSVIFKGLSEDEIKLIVGN